MRYYDVLPLYKMKRRNIIISLTDLAIKLKNGVFCKTENFKSFLDSELMMHIYTSNLW